MSLIVDTLEGTIDYSLVDPRKVDLMTYAKDKQAYGETFDYSPTILRTPRLVLTPVRNKVYSEGRL